MTTRSGTQRDAQPAVRVGGVLGAAAEADRVLDLVAADLPRVAVAQPAIGALDLPAVADVLIEDAELVAQAVADRRDVERRERVHVAGGEPAEAAVAEARLLLVLEQLVERDARASPSAARAAVVEAEREQVRAELRADQELGRQVDDACGACPRGRSRAESTQRCSTRSRTAYASARK